MDGSLDRLDSTRHDTTRHIAVLTPLLSQYNAAVRIQPFFSFFLRGREGVFAALGLRGRVLDKLDAFGDLFSEVGQHFLELLLLKRIHFAHTLHLLDTVEAKRDG